MTDRGLQVFCSRHTSGEMSGKLTEVIAEETKKSPKLESRKMDLTRDVHLKLTNVGDISILRL